MKTYIWNSEYEVYAANAKDENSARWQILQKFIEKSCEGLLDEKDREKDDWSYKSVPPYVYARAKSVFRSDMQDILWALVRPADEIVDEGGAVVYCHANE